MIIYECKSIASRCAPLRNNATSITFFILDQVNTIEMRIRKKSFIDILCFSLVDCIIKFILENLNSNFSGY